MSKIVPSKIKLFYNGTFDSCPFEKNEICSIEPIEYCDKGQKREEDYEKLLKERRKTFTALDLEKTQNHRASKHESCCEPCKTTIRREKNSEMYLEMGGLSNPVEVDVKRFKTIDGNKPKGDLVQCESGSTHTLLLNSEGQVFSFGQGLEGQLGTGERKILQNRPTELKMHEDLELKVDKSLLTTKITRISAKYNDSAGLDDHNNRFFTWGSFGTLRIERNGKK